MIVIENEYTCNACGATMTITGDRDPFWKGSAVQGWHRVGSAAHLCPECHARYVDRLEADNRRLNEDFGL